jgi:hypothetical protein
MSSGIRDGTHSSRQMARIVVALALKRTKCRVDVSYSTFITGTCDCFAGARLLLSRCYVELGRSALQTWTIGVKGASSLRFSVFFQWDWMYLSAKRGDRDR